MKEKIEEIMKPAKSAMGTYDYPEAVTIGSSFGKLITIIEEQQKEIEQLKADRAKFAYDELPKTVSNEHERV